MRWDKSTVSQIYSRRWCERGPQYVLSVRSIKLITNLKSFLLAFYFNFKDSFYGEIEPLSASGRRTLPHLGFLATPLLPCGHYDDPVQKFTGSDNLGPADNGLTQAI